MRALEGAGWDRPKTPKVHVPREPGQPLSVTKHNTVRINCKKPWGRESLKNKAIQTISYMCELAFKLPFLFVKVMKKENATKSCIFTAGSHFLHLVV